jgi:hypothetical protein
MTQPAPTVQPTQVRHPARAVARTIFAALPLVPLVVAELGVGSLPWVAAGLAVVGAVTRVLADRRVDDWLRDYLPWLAAAPAPKE